MGVTPLEQIAWFQTATLTLLFLVVGLRVYKTAQTDRYMRWLYRYLPGIASFEEAGPSPQRVERSMASVLAKLERQMHDQPARPLKARARPLDRDRETTARRLSGSELPPQRTRLSSGPRYTRPLRTTRPEEDTATDNQLDLDFYLPPPAALPPRLPESRPIRPAGPSIPLTIRNLDRAGFDVQFDGVVSIKARGEIDSRVPLSVGKRTLTLVAPGRSDPLDEIVIDTEGSDLIDLQVLEGNRFHFVTEPHSFTLLSHKHSAESRPDEVEERAIPVEFEIESLDGQWADVLVDGRVIAELRDEPKAWVRLQGRELRMSVRSYSNERAYVEFIVRLSDIRQVRLAIAEGIPPLLEGAAISRYLHWPLSTSKDP